MVYKSLLLSIALTFFLGYAFTIGITTPNSLIKKLPDWCAIPLLGGVFVLYLLAGWWAIKGFGDHKIVALISMGFCTLGIGFYAVGFAMELGHGKASPGQYDYDFSRLDATEKDALTQIATNAGLTLQDATFSEHWHMMENASGFRTCVQKGHVTALRFSGKKIPDLALFSRFPKLGDLYLVDCGLADMSDLHTAQVERLDVSHNRITDLKTLSGCPNVRWLFVQDNQLHSDAGIELFTKLLSQDLSGNAFSRE
ncbi:MAG: hypothetical protein ABI763_09140 [Bacteroidota bacterium]